MGILSVIQGGGIERTDAKAQETCRFGLRQKALLVTCLTAVAKMPE